MVLELRRKESDNLEMQKAWASAVLVGVQSLAPPGGILRNVRGRDQVRALVLWILLPNWPALLDPWSAEVEARTRAPEAFDSMQQLLLTIARLPIEGRQAFRDVVAEECADIFVLRDLLLTSARSFANAALRSSIRSGKFAAPLWEAVLLLQLLWLGDMRRVEIAAEAAQAARTADAGVMAPVRPGTIGRSLSKLAGESRNTVFLEGPNATMASPLPRSCFHFQALLDFSIHPRAEREAFDKNAKYTVLNPTDLITQPKWEIDPKQGGLPKEFMSFMTHGNLVPIAFKQLVLQDENVSQQRESQQSAAGGLLPLLIFGGAIPVPAEAVFFVLEVGRNSVTNDTMRILPQVPDEVLRRPLKVKFRNEEGVDEGGVAREFFRLLSGQLFSPDYCAFKEDADSKYVWFNPAAFEDPSELTENDFITFGKVLGLVVYNNLPGFDVNFVPALFKKLKGEETTFEDFRQAFPSHATSLQAVLDWRPPIGMSPEESTEMFQDTFCLDFSVSYEVLGATVTKVLKGSDDNPEPVTLANRAEFAQKFQEWYLDTGVSRQFEAFKKGYGSVCGNLPVYRCLSSAELEAIVCGEKDLDFDNLRKGAVVVDSEVKFAEGYLDQLWDLLLSFDTMQKRQFLKFVAGSDIAPVGGLKQLGLRIQRNGGEPTDRLPTSQTCFNLLLLPEYSDAAKLKKLLTTAIENAEGFGLQ